ncbi:MAG TPA: nicotinate phosphoribosyltransferase [Syntrophales bacterium]|nr:nicotinate phosphoribosyltransferase [Syntrophales bacterium]HRT62351.1 nicotinate phosphoribosyltransferase [Syntrophales bacterium]
MDLMKTPLLTDLYQLTMMQAYLDRQMHETAVFEFFIRTLPEQRGFLLAAGLESVIEFLEALKFSDEELTYLSESGRFSKAMIDYLARFCFQGDVDAMPEGSVFFPDEPILRVAAPLPVAQFVETRVINLLHVQTLLASKAARCFLAAGGRVRLIDFGPRRAHGSEAGLWAARSSYIAGFDGTSTVLAGHLYGIPTFGTMAHSFIEAHDDEREAFIHFAESNPRIVTLLIDTYDTVAGAGKAVEIKETLDRKGIPIRGVRLDSGDLLDLSRKVRAIFDRSGMRDAQIFASGNIDEHVIRDLLSAGAPIDAFGVGTRLNTSSDIPYLDCAYKLMEYAGQPRLKKSEGKATWPGRKQVFRFFREGRMTGDVLTLEGDPKEGTPLIRPVMRCGRRIEEPGRLADIRAYALRQISALPEGLKVLTRPPPYPVEVAPALKQLKTAVEKKSG